MGSAASVTEGTVPSSNSELVSHSEQEDWGRRERLIWRFSSCYSTATQVLILTYVRC